MERNFELVGYLVVIPIICCFGLAGNVLTLIVLRNKQFGGTAYLYLRALAVFDSLSLLFILPICFIRYPTRLDIDKDFMLIFEGYIYIQIGDIFIKASILTVLVFTVERCLVVCFQSRHKFDRVRYGGQIFIIINLVSVTLENIPTFYMYKINEDRELELTDFGDSHDFLIYIWFDAIMFQYLPMVTLSVFNIILITFIRKQWKIRQKLSATEYMEQRTKSEQLRIIMTLVSILMLFFVTMVPSAILNILATNYELDSSVFEIFQVTVTILVTLNFSCNFVLYCCINRRFLKALRIFLCCGRATRQVFPLNTRQTGEMKPEQ